MEGGPFNITYAFFFTGLILPLQVCIHELQHLLFPVSFQCFKPGTMCFQKGSTMTCTTSVVMISCVIKKYNRKIYLGNTAYCKITHAWSVPLPLTCDISGGLSSLSSSTHSEALYFSWNGIWISSLGSAPQLTARVLAAAHVSDTWPWQW